MRTLFSTIQATAAEKSAALFGDNLVLSAEVVMDTAFTLPAPPTQVWPWILQLGKTRSGWYFSRKAGWFILPGRRGLRHIEPSLQTLKVGDFIDDWGGKNAVFEAVTITPPHALIYKSKRGNTSLSWAIILTPIGTDATRLHFRLRLTPVKHPRLAKIGGGFFDKLTIAWLAAGLRERVAQASNPEG